MLNSGFQEVNILIGSQTAWSDAIVHERRDILAMADIYSSSKQPSRGIILLTGRALNRFHDLRGVGEEIVTSPESRRAERAPCIASFSRERGESVV